MYRILQICLMLVGLSAFIGNAWAICTLPDGVEGEIFYNKDQKLVQYCDGERWIGMGWKRYLMRAQGANGRVQFAQDGLLATDGGLVWDNTHKRLGVGTQSPDEALHVEGVFTLGGGTQIWSEGGGLRFKGVSDVEGNGAVFYDGDDNILVRIRTANYSGAPLRVDGLATYTTSNAANVYVSSAGNFARVTSSARYKDDIQDLTAEERAQGLSLRPVSYISKAAGDNPQERFFGFIAEEVAEHAPMLVQWSMDEDSQQNIPDGVAYERVTVLLQAIIQDQQKKIDDLERRLGALEEVLK